MIAAFDNRAAVTRELCGWQDGDGTRGRAFLVIDVAEQQRVAPYRTTAHEPVQYPALCLSGHVRFYSDGEEVGSARGGEALTQLGWVYAAGSCWRGRPLMDAVTPILLMLDRWGGNGTRGTCDHAPRDAHACPGRGLGCRCCPLDAPMVVEVQGGVGIVRAGGRIEARERCVHDAVGVDYGCGYRQWSAWLYEPLPEGLLAWLQDEIGGHDLLDAAARVMAIASRRAEATPQ